MKRLCIAAVVIGLAAYAVVFYATPLPSVCDDAGRPLLRGELLAQLLLLPDKWLLPNWFGAPPQFSILDRLPVLLVAGTILAWAAAVGWLLLRFPENSCHGETPPYCNGGEAGSGKNSLEVFVFSTAVGLSVLSTWVLLLGLLGVMDRLWMFVVPSLATVAAAGYVYFNNRRRLTACRVRHADLEDAKNSVMVRVADPTLSHADYGNPLSPHWLWLALPFVLVMLLAAMLPPLDFDVREYHLQAPKEFLLQGRIAFVPHNVYANMAMGAEMLGLLAMVVAGDWWLGALAGKTVVAAFTPLTALALLLAGRRLFSPAAGVVAALVYLSIPWVVFAASAGTIPFAGFAEGASACYLFLAVYALLLRDGRGMTVQASQQRVRSTLPTSHLALAGYLAGAAVATKYPAVLFVLLPLMAWVVFGTRPQPSHSFITVAAKRAMVFLLAAALGCGLWFGKNWVLAGNPTYPLLYEVFDGKTWTAAKERQWNRVHRPDDFSAKTLGTDLGRVVLTSEWLSPLLVPLAMLAFVGRRRRASWHVRSSTVVWGLLAYIGFVIATWWLLTHRIDRFWLPVLPIAALLAGAGACWSSERWWRWMLAVVLAAGLGANFLVAASGQPNAWFVPLARLRNASGWIDPWHEYFNTHPSEGQLLTVGEADVFDLTVPVLYNTCFDDCIFEQLVRGKTAMEVRAALAARRVTRVYVNWGEIARYRSPGNYGFTDFVQPEVFDRLVAEGVLTPLPPIEGHSGRGYRVR